MVEKEIAEILLNVGAVEINPNEPFIWASGIESPIYCDNRLTMSDPVGRKKIAEGLANLIRTKLSGNNNHRRNSNCWNPTCCMGSRYSWFANGLCSIISKRTWKKSPN